MGQSFPLTHPNESLCERQSVTLQEAKLLVMADVTNVAESSASGLRYKFISYAELVKALRSSMIVHGVTVRPTAVHSVDTDIYETSRGARMQNVSGIFCFEFSYGEDTEAVQVLAQAADSGDKAASKAQTQAMKYALRQFFLIETDEDDPDYQNHERASTRLNKLQDKLGDAETVDEVKDLMKLAFDPDFVAFTPSQQGKLRSIFSERIEELEAKTTSSRRTDKPEETESGGDS